MARGRAAVTLSIVILAVACLVVRVKAEAASLNVTVHDDDDVVAQNEVPHSHESEGNTKNDDELSQHPHNTHGKPTKFDLVYPDRAEYQIETTRIANVTANPIVMDSTADRSPSNSTSDECDGKLLTVPCIRKDLFNFLDHLSRVDTYNVTDSVQLIRNPEADVACNDDRENDDSDPDSKLLDEVHRYARTHVMKIRLNKDLSLARKARTFFGCEFPAIACVLRLRNFFFVACVLVPLHIARATKGGFR